MSASQQILMFTNVSTEVCDLKDSLRLYHVSLCSAFQCPFVLIGKSEICESPKSEKVKVHNLSKPPEKFIYRFELARYADND